MTSGIIPHIILPCSVIILTVTGIVFFIRFIINRYRRFDYLETIKEENLDLIAKINDAQLYFRRKYDNEDNSAVFRNISSKVDFCLGIIGNHDPQRQRKELKELFDMLYETEYRLQRNFNDVFYICHPLNRITENLAREQIEYLKAISKQ